MANSTAVNTTIVYTLQVTQEFPGTPAYPFKVNLYEDNTLSLDGTNQFLGNWTIGDSGIVMTITFPGDLQQGPPPHSATLYSAKIDIALGGGTITDGQARGSNAESAPEIVNGAWQGELVGPLNAS